MDVERDIERMNAIFKKVYECTVDGEEEGLDSKIDNSSKAFTFHSVASDEVKSMLQKACRLNRRDDVTNAVFEYIMYAARLIYLKRLVEKLEKKKLNLDKSSSVDNLVKAKIEAYGYIDLKSRLKSIKSQMSPCKSAMTSLVNRIKVIAVEDIGIGDVELPIFLNDKLKKIGDPAFYGELSNFKQLILMTHQIAERLADKSKKKCRYPSGIRAYYYTLYNIDQDNGSLDEYRIEGITGSYLSDLTVEQCESKFKKLFLKKDNGCFMYLLQILLRMEKKEGVKKETYVMVPDNIKRACTLMDWITSRSKLSNSKLYQVLKDWFLNVKTKPMKMNGKWSPGEFWIFMVQIVLIELKGIKIETPTKKNNCAMAMTMVATDDLKSLREFWNFLKKSTLDIKDEYVDIHTKRGRRMGKSKIDFVKCGSKVDEDCELIDDHITRYKELYNKIGLLGQQEKEETSTKKKPSKKRKVMEESDSDEEEDRAPRKKKKKE